LVFTDSSVSSVATLLPLPLNNSSIVTPTSRPRQRSHARLIPRGMLGEA